MTGFGTGPTIVYISGIILAIRRSDLLFTQIPTDCWWRLTIHLRRRWGFQAVLLGSLALLFGGIPFWATNYPIGLEFPWDRFTLAMIVGSSLLITGLIDLVTPNLVVKAVAFGIVIGLATGLHLQYSNSIPARVELTEAVLLADGLACTCN